VAYRGRILVDIFSVLDRTLTKTIVRGFNPADRFQRMDKYKLMGIFFNANMVHPSDKQVEFEISIGKSGNISVLSRAYVSIWQGEGMQASM
jgi:hypothetical protein